MKISLILFFAIFTNKTRGRGRRKKLLQQLCWRCSYFVFPQRGSGGRQRVANAISFGNSLSLQNFQYLKKASLSLFLLEGVNIFCTVGEMQKSANPCLHCSTLLLFLYFAEIWINQACGASPLPTPSPLCPALHLATKLILFVDIIVTYCITKDGKGLQKDSFVFATLFFKKFDICKLCYHHGEREKIFEKCCKYPAGGDKGKFAKGFFLKEEIKENLQISQKGGRGFHVLALFVDNLEVFLDKIFFGKKFAYFECIFKWLPQIAKMNI